MKNTIVYRHPRIEHLKVTFTPRRPGATSEAFWPHEDECVKVEDLNGQLNLNTEEVTDIHFVSHARASAWCNALKRRGFVRL